MTLVMKRMDVFREMTLVICSGHCLQECELKHLSVPEGPRWSDLYTHCTRLYVGQPCPSVLCSRDDFRPNVCLTVWPNMCKIFASLLHDAIGLALQNVASFAVHNFARASIFRLSLRASEICF